MTTPHATFGGGYLEKKDVGLIEVPDLIANTPDTTWRPYVADCFKQGYFTGWTNAIDQFRQGRLGDSVKYILEAKGATPTQVTDALRALQGALPNFP